MRQKHWCSTNNVSSTTRGHVNPNMLFVKQCTCLIQQISHRTQIKCVWVWVWVSSRKWWILGDVVLWAYQVVTQTTSLGAVHIPGVRRRVRGPQSRWSWSRRHPSSAGTEPAGTQSTQRPPRIAPTRRPRCSWWCWRAGPTAPQWGLGGKILATQTSSIFQYTVSKGEHALDIKC